MRETLQDIITRLGKGEYQNEEHIRLALVCRLLRELGWDIWNPREVFPEFKAMPNEDATRVDVALFMPPQLLRPAVFIEVKSLGKLSPFLEAAELQLRDYNRNNQAELSILTDGRLWRFYLPGAAGEFPRKCFEKIDLLSEESKLDDVELAFDTFLSKHSLQSGGAVDEARRYLKRTDAERVMFDVLPIAQRDVDDDPTVTLVDCFLRRCAEKGVDCDHDNAVHFIKNSRAKSAANNSGFFVSDSIQPNQKHTESTKIKHLEQTVGRIEGKQFRLANKRGADALGVHSDAGCFVVYKGSVAAKHSPGFSGGYRKLYDQLVHDQILVAESRNGQHVFKLTKDYEFKSPSAAASIFCGRSANGGEWKN